MDGLSGKVALITGGAAGIGKAIGQRLAREGCAIGILDIDGKAAEATAKELRESGARVEARQGSVADAESAKAAADALSAALGPIDILVNNAGVSRFGKVLDGPEADWRLQFSVNVDGTWHMCRAVVPGMVARKRGVVVNMSSWLGKRGWANFGAYAATKFAVIGLTQSLAMEVAADGVRVNAVCPGMIVGTPMREGLDAQAAEQGIPLSKDRVSAIPLQRAGTAEDVARTVAFLASDEAAYLTGSTIDVAGGLWMS